MGWSVAWQSGADFLEQIGNQAFRLTNHRQQQMFAVHFLVGIALGDALRLLQSFLTFYGKPIQLHILLIKRAAVTSSWRNGEMPWGSIGPNQAPHPTSLSSSKGRTAVTESQERDYGLGAQMAR